MATINSIYSSKPLTVGQGGLGAASFTANGILYGNTASAVQVTAAGTNGQVLIGSTGAPAFATLTSTDGTITYTPGANSLSMQITNWVDKTSWTPTLSFGGGTTGITYTTQSGTYARVFNIVYFNMNITLSNKGSSTGAMSIGGLPIAVASVAQVPSWEFDNLTYTGFIIPNIASGGTAITLSQVTNAGGAAAVLDDTAFANTSAILLQGAYFV